ncbi:MAG: O-antigen ligase family protein [Geminicoccaceae bacterium]
MALATPQPARMRALNTLLGDRRPRGFLRRIDWWVGQLCSFEVMFTLFLYSNELKSIVPFPFPVDETVVFGGLCIPMMGYVAWREGLYVRGISVVTGALIFIFWAIITTTWSIAHKTAVRSIMYLLTFTLLSIVAGGMVIANKRERAVRFFYCALVVAMFMALVGIYIQLKTGDFRRWSQLDGTGRVYLAFGHTVVNGAGIAFCIGLFSRVGSVRQVLGTMMFATCCFFLLVGGGRGPFLGAAVAAMVGLTTRPPMVRHGRVEVPLATVAAIMMVILAAGYIAYLFASGNLTTTLSRFTQLEEESERATTINGINRWDLWKAAYHLWLSAPWVGHGLNSFPVLYKGIETDLLHPHDIFLEMLCETGLVGFGLFLVFMAIGGINATYRRLQTDPLMVCAVLYVITSAMSALFGRDIVGVRKFFFALCLLALRPPARKIEAPEAEEQAAEDEQDRAPQRALMLARVDAIEPLAHRSAPSA